MFQIKLFLINVLNKIYTQLQIIKKSWEIFFLSNMFIKIHFMKMMI